MKRYLVGFLTKKRDITILNIIETISISLCLGMLISAVIFKIL